MVNIPANIDGFPRNDADHDLGHVVTIVDGQLKRRNQRSYFEQIAGLLEKQEEKKDA